MIASFLSGIPLFTPLSAADLALVARSGRMHNGVAGELVIQQGNAAESLFVTLSGRVEVRDQSGPGTLAELGPGSYFGELALVDGGRRSATVTCVEPCEFFVLDREDFLRLVASSGPLASRLFADIGERLRGANAAYQNQHRRSDNLEQENRRLAAELEIACRLQLMVLPGQAELDGIDELEVAGFMEPANEVGGDYYDVRRAGEATLIAIGDVAGHGLESGVIMLMAQTAVSTLVNAGENDLRRALEVINRVICDSNRRLGRDLPLTLCLLSYQLGTLRCCGQHEHILILRASGAIETIDTESLGLWLGLHDHITPWLAEHAVTLAPGDTVVLHTDGVTEARGADAGELYGLQRLQASLAGCGGLSAQATRQVLERDLRQFIGTRPLDDDITLVVLRRK